MILYTIDIDSAVAVGELMRPCCFCKRLAAYRHFRCGQPTFLCHLCFVALRDLGKVMSLAAACRLEDALRVLDDKEPR